MRVTEIEQRRAEIQDAILNPQQQPPDADAIIDDLVKFYEAVLADIADGPDYPAAAKANAALGRPRRRQRGSAEPHQPEQARK